MVWLPLQSLLVCSVYDSIQVWDMSKYERVNLFRGHVLGMQILQFLVPTGHLTTDCSF